MQAAAKGERLPSWRVAEAFAMACGADTAGVQAIRELWEDAWTADGRQVPDGAPDIPPAPSPGSVTSAAEFIALLNRLRA